MPKYILKEELEKYEIKTGTSGVVVPLDELAILRADTFSRGMEQRKPNEKQYQDDGKNIKKRTGTGKKAELAVEQIIQETYTDDTIGDTSEHSHPDLKSLGMEIGVKGVTPPNFPVIFKKSKIPEIIAIVSPTYVKVLGVASVDNLNTFQWDDGIGDPNLRKKGYKTTFWNLETIMPFRSRKELEEIYHFTKLGQYIDWD